MAHSTRRVAIPSRTGKPKRKRRQDEGAFQDVFTMDFPQEILAGPFRVVIPLDGHRRNTPNPVVEPKAKED